MVDRQRRTWLFIALAFLLVAGLGLVDYWTGAEISFAVFYLLPVFVAAWFAGHWGGVFTSVVSALVWFSADKLAGGAYSHPAIHYWNMTTRFLFFLAVTLLLSAHKHRWKREEQWARMDGLTGVTNARFFLHLCEREIGRARRYGRPLTLIYMDADNFKVVNDLRGHAAGDALLQALAATIKSTVRSTDIVARLGGDEFAILLPETGYDPAQGVARKVQQLLLDVAANEGRPVTFSLGVVTFLTPPDSVTEMIRLADDLMYAAKRDGKNRIKHSLWDG